MKSIKLLIIVACCLVFANVAVAQTQTPAIEYSSLLDSFTVKFRGESGLGNAGGKLVFNDKHEIMGVFIPEVIGADQMQVDLVKSGSNKALIKYPCTVRKSGSSAFSMITIDDGQAGYVFREEGDYALRFLLADKVITKMPFNVSFKKQGDAFDRKTYTFVDGDWSNLAYLSFSADKPESALQFFTWTRKVAFSTTPEASKMDVTLLQDNEVIAITPTGTVAWPEWQHREVTFRFPDNQGGKVFNNTDLLKRTGKLTVRVDLDGKPHQFFNLEVRDGKIVDHKRQAMDYSPRENWLCPRKIRLGLDGTGHVFWLEKSKTADSNLADASPAPAVAAKAEWVVKSDVDPSRRFEIKHTNIRSRKDQSVSIGDEIVAYATGSSLGVGYFVVGEDKPRSIKNGQNYRSDLFFACGKLIVMATRNNVTVYSTEVDRSVDIPNEEIHLRYEKAGLFGPQMADADGYLVATVNEPAGLKTKTIVNVIDLSGDNKPIVIPIKNSDFQTSEVTTIKVNAKTGKVAVGCKRKGAIYIADVAPDATFKKFDVSGFDSFGETEMVLTESHVLYTDAAGFANVRLLDLATGEVTMPAANQYAGGFGPLGTSNGSTIAWAIKQPRNSWAVGKLGDEAAPLVNTNFKSPFGSNHGKLGSGRSMAMADDGTLFIAGTKSISTSNCLQATSNGEWTLVTGDDDQPIPAINVVSGNSMIVFKTGEPSTSTEVNISYATFGSNVTLPSSGKSTQVANKPMEETNERAPEATMQNSVSLSETDKAFLKSVVVTEETIFNALKNSTSEPEARKRARETGIKSLETNEKQHLIEHYKETWK